MNRRGALAHAAFEVLDGEDRDRVRWRAPRPRPECSAHIVELCEAIGDTAVILAPRRSPEAAIGLSFPDRRPRPSDTPGRLPHRTGGFTAFVRMTGPRTAPKRTERGRGGHEGISRCRT